MFLNTDQLDFLGCFCCDHSVTSRQTRLPAVRIASEESEPNLYTDLDTYSERPLFLLDVLNHLFELYRDEAIQDKLLGGFLIMNIMDKYLDHSRIQISGCASLFYVLKYWKGRYFFEAYIAFSRHTILFIGVGKFFLSTHYFS